MRTDFLEKAKEVTGVTAINTIVDRFLNQANHDIHLERWYWAERRATIRTFDPYSTGTVDVAITNLTTRRAVTGTSTVWNTANSFGDTPAQVGMKMTLGATGIVHLVSAVGSDTAITLDTSTPYMGDAALDDSGYTLYQDEYSLPSDFDDVCDMRIFSEARKIALIGAQDFNLRYPRNSVLGAPRVATLVELGPSASVALRRRVVFGPAPFQQDLIPYRYYTTNLAVSATGTGAGTGSVPTGNTGSAVSRHHHTTNLCNSNRGRSIKRFTNWKLDNQPGRTCRPPPTSRSSRSGGARASSTRPSNSGTSRARRTRRRRRSGAGSTRR